METTFGFHLTSSKKLEPDEQFDAQGWGKDPVFRVTYIKTSNAGNGLDLHGFAYKKDGTVGKATRNVTTHNQEKIEAMPPVVHEFLAAQKAMYEAMRSLCSPD